MAITPTQEMYLENMGIQLWTPRDKTEAADRGAAVGDAVNDGEWEELQQSVANCTSCDLHKTRKNTVFGAGNKNADLLFIGEAPGATEDAQGIPFVGRAGKLLDSILYAIGLTREDVFIANILKCRPPNNRDPSPREVKLCTPYLKQQIAYIKPKVIVAVGRIAAHFLLDTDLAMGKLRGHVFQYGETNIPLIVTYHPAYLLRSPREKAKAYADFLKIQSMLQELN